MNNNSKVISHKSHIRKSSELNTSEEQAAKNVITKDTQPPKFNRNRCTSKSLKKRIVHESFKDKNNNSDYESKSSRLQNREMSSRIRSKKIKIEKNNIKKAVVEPKRPETPPVPERPPCKIKFHSGREDYSHLNDSKINEVIRDFIEFCILTFKNKDPENVDYFKIQRVGKKLGLKLNIKQMQEEGFKNKEFINPIKEKCLYRLWEIFNSENGLDKTVSIKKGNAKCFKFHVGKGNNGHLIRNLMNQRWWWQSHPKENINDLNFLWTQWKVDSQLYKLPSKIPKPLTITREKSEEKEDNDQLNSKTEIDEIDESTKNTTKNEICLPAIVQSIDGNKCYNRLEDNFQLTSKKYLYLNMKEYYEKLGYDVFSILPITFHIKEGEKDSEFHKFEEFYNKRGEEILSDPTKKNAWIIKPGENSNRGFGITVSDNLEDIK